MREVSVSTVISAPREEVFDFVADLAARPTFTEHFMEDYRLARVQPVGVGAAARFKLDAPLANEYRKASEPSVLVFELEIARESQPLETPKLINKLDSLIERDYLSDRFQLLPLIRELTEDERVPLVGRNQAARILKKLEKQTQ